MTISLRLTTTEKQFQKMVLQEMVNKLTPAMGKATFKIEKALKINLRQIIRQTDTYQAILEGPLNAHFGIRRGEEKQRLENIINALMVGLKVYFKPPRLRGNSIEGGYLITAIKSDFSEVLGLPDGITVSKGVSLPWLNWLLTQGDSIIISDYSIDFGNYTTTSRSGEAIMIPNNAGSWRVPLAVSGTINSNWFTRMIEQFRNQISNLISKIIHDSIESSF